MAESDLGLRHASWRYARLGYDSRSRAAAAGGGTGGTAVGSRVPRWRQPGPARLTGGPEGLADLAVIAMQLFPRARRPSRVPAMTSAGSGAGRLLVYRRLADLLDRRLEPGAGLVTAVAAGQGDDPQDARISGQVAVQARPGRDGDLQHHGRALRQRLDVLGDGVAQQRLSLLLGRAADAGLGSMTGTRPAAMIRLA